MSEGQEEFRDRIATVNEKGKRVWIFPKKPSGLWYNRRKILSYFLLAILFLAPHIKIQGEPLLMFNIIERKFVIFGQVFWPSEVYLFALGMIIIVIVVVLFTLIFGRLFCGWVCPQTIFMEMLFRRIEYWIEGDWTQQKRLKKLPWKGEKIRKRLIKWLLFYIISFFIANTFLAYIIGNEALWQIITDPPSQHVVGLLALLIFTTIFFFVFLSFREQVCTVVCPYGRLQGVLLDNKSMIVAYDYVRGEKRAKIRKNEDRKEAGKGDCIDCNQCVHVCPTGIDIRHGTQLECIGCTACIDACDDMMDKVGLPKGLVRYASEDNIAKNKPFKYSTKTKAYTVLMVLLMAVFTLLLFNRDDIQAKFLRVRGTTYTKNKGVVTNMFKFSISNKTSELKKIQLEFEDFDADLFIIGDSIIVQPGTTFTGQIVVKSKQENMKRHKTPVNIEVIANGELEAVEQIKLLGPK